MAVKTFNQAQGSYLVYHYQMGIIIIVYFPVLDVLQANIKFHRPLFQYRTNEAVSLRQKLVEI